MITNKTTTTTIIMIMRTSTMTMATIISVLLGGPSLLSAPCVVVTTGPASIEKTKCFELLNISNYTVTKFNSEFDKLKATSLNNTLVGIARSQGSSPPIHKNHFTKKHIV